MNNISQYQLQKQQLNRLSAQRQLYTDVKTIMVIQVIIAVPAVIIWYFSVMVFPELRVYAALWGIFAALIDILLLNPRQKGGTATVFRVGFVKPFLNKSGVRLESGSN